MIKLLEQSSTELVEVGFWQHYQILRYDKVIFDGFKLLEIDLDDTTKGEIEDAITKHIEAIGGIEKFPKLNELRDFTSSIILWCHNSDNEMFFIDEDSECLGYVNLNEVMDDLDKWNLNDVIEIDETHIEDAMITVYGGVSERINFLDR